jgi:hypothetical protein
VPSATRSRDLACPWCGGKLLEFYAASRCFFCRCRARTGGTPETWLAAVSIKSSLPVIDELVVAKYGDGPVRVASDGSDLRVFRAAYPFKILSLSRLLRDGIGYIVPGTGTHVHIGPNNGIVVLSGTDGAGSPIAGRAGFCWT